MDRGLEIAGAASVGGWMRWRRQHTVEVGTPCSNCGTPIQGAYCHSCGQLAENFHRSIGHLIVEGFESFFHWDGRLFQTLPKLALKPGLLTREYLDGKRAAQIPPLRLFLVVLLILFFVGGLNLGGGGKTNVSLAKPGASPVQLSADGHPIKLTPAEKAQIQSSFFNPKTVQAIVAKAKARQDAAEAAAKAHPQAAAPKPAAEPDTTVTVAGKPLPPETSAWFKARIMKAMANPELYWMTVESWGHRLAFLMLPIAALLLSVLFVFQRRFFIYDHLIFSMHSLAFQGLLISAFLGLDAVIGGWSWLLLLLAPVHLFVHMRGAYGTSVFGTLLRMILLGLASFFAFLALMLGILWIGLNAFPAH